MTVEVDEAEVWRGAQAVIYLLTERSKKSKTPGTAESFVASCVAILCAALALVVRTFMDDEHLSEGFELAHAQLDDMAEYMIARRPYTPMEKH
jgi:hypothetical protein